MTERSSQPQHIEVKKRRKTRIGSLPYKTTHLNKFDNSKLGVKSNHNEAYAKTYDARRQVGAIDRKAIAIKTANGDPNNLSNRFFSLRR